MSTEEEFENNLKTAAFEALKKHKNLFKSGVEDNTIKKVAIDVAEAATGALMDEFKKELFPLPLS